MLGAYLKFLPPSHNPRQHFSAYGLRVAARVSICHVTLPSERTWVLPSVQHGACGERSWNVGWDARPAWWLHKPDSGWLLVAAPFGVVDVVHKVGNGEKEDVLLGTNGDLDSKYTVEGVKADGRCLFRAIAHVACVRNGDVAPDENRQRELADNLRAQVVDELLKRRKETAWFIEEDFDAYVNRIQQPYVWGGEPELLMSSHVLKTPISVFMVDKSSGKLIKIADYGEEYHKDDKYPITILFHRYGHYDILEAVLDKEDNSILL